MSKELEILSADGAKPTGQTVQVPQALLESRPNTALLHEVVEALEGNWRQGTHSTLTRSEVRGGGHKPWKQKHTGRARSGSTTSPLWRKGGIAFGPKPRSYETRVPQGKRQLALAQALNNRLQDSLKVVAESSLESITKTKDFNRSIDLLGNKAGNCLVVVSKANPNVIRSSRNIPGVNVRLARQVNARDVLVSSSIVVTDQAWAGLMEVCGCGQ